MKILAIETSCDETAVAILEARGDEKSATFTVLGNALLSQTVHAEYGGVFPALAKREHAKNLVPLLSAALQEAELLREDTRALSEEKRNAVAKLLEREPGLSEAFFAFVSECEPPPLDAIAVTHGPGLEPALWVGINFAKALSAVWNLPLVPVNHLEGHILAALANEEEQGLSIVPPPLPLLALGIAGGHTDLVLMNEWLSYEAVGQTLDDSVGEAFDKVARMLELPYPGGPHISKLAESARTKGYAPRYPLPRPMLHSGTCDFSFSGLKTAVLYLLKDTSEVTDEDKEHIALEFENAVGDVLWTKTRAALEKHHAQTLVVSGGVSANTHVRRTFAEHIATEFPNVALRIPPPVLATDNAVMIALAGYFRALRQEFASDIRADGNLSLAAK